MIEIDLLIIWLFIINLEVNRNFIMIERLKQRPNYLLSFILRAMASILHGAAFDVQTYTQAGVLFTFQLTTFFVLFSPALNYLRGKTFWYLGQESGWLDDLLADIPYFYKFLYYGVAIIALLSYICIIGLW